MSPTGNGSRQRRCALAAVSLGVLCVQLDAFALNTALPAVGRDLNADGGLSWVVSTYLLAAGTLMLGSGRMGDLLGRRRLLLVGLLLFGTASLVCALAPSLPVLIATRLVQGAGGALITPVGLALVTNAFPPGARARAIGAALGVAGLATACGPFVGGVATQLVSWRAVFWINVPLTALAAVWTALTAESRDITAPARLDWPGLITGSAACATVVVLVDRGQAWGWRSVDTAALLVVALLLVTAFIAVEHSTTHSLVQPALFRNRAYVVLTASGAVANAATVVFLFVVPLSLQGTWGMSAATAGVAFLAPATLIAAAGPLAGRVEASRAVPMMAFCLGTAGLVLCAAPLTVGLPAYLVTTAVAGTALGAANALTLAATQTLVRAERAGEAAGVTKTAVTIAGGLGVILTGTTADPVAGAAETALAPAGAGCLTVGIALGLGLRLPRGITVR